MKLARGVKVDLKADNSIRTVLGLNAKFHKENRNDSQHTIDIMRVKSIFVHCNLIGSSHLNNCQQPATLGEIIIKRTSTLIYLPVAMDVIPHMTSWLTD